MLQLFFSKILISTKIFFLNDNRPLAHFSDLKYMLQHFLIGVIALIMCAKVSPFIQNTCNMALVEIVRPRLFESSQIFIFPSHIYNLEFN